MAEKYDTSAHAIGQRIKNARLALGISQTKIAEVAGAGKSTVSGWEHGRTSPTHTQIAPVADLLGLPIDYLVTGSFDYLNVQQITRLGLQITPKHD